MEALKAPFVWFGGKASIADAVWARLGRVDTYVEPFFGSGAVLLGNPHWEGCVETVNDIDNFVCNAWRAIAAAPDEVARFADWPVNECDLHARHVWLVNEGRERIAACEHDPLHYDAQVAGWWLWGMANWIGGGFCSGEGPWTAEMLAAARAAGTYDAKEIVRRRPHLGDAGQGVQRKLPHLGDPGKGVKRQRPHLGDAGQGVQRKRPHLGDAGQGVQRRLGEYGGAGIFPRNDGLYDYLHQLAWRLRDVRVCCGDWERICGPAVTWAGEDGSTRATCGMFLDPPYSAEAGRNMNIYSRDCGAVAHRVRAWCIANGDNRLMHIALCGYEGEHEELAALGWSVLEWKASGGYSSSAVADDSNGKLNRGRERIWFSPYCRAEPQGRLF